jgi:hypothetical protein
VINHCYLPSFHSIGALIEEEKLYTKKMFENKQMENSKPGNLKGMRIPRPREGVR